MVPVCGAPGQFCENALCTLLKDLGAAQTGEWRMRDKGWKRWLPVPSLVHPSVFILSSFLKGESPRVMPPKAADFNVGAETRAGRHGIQRRARFWKVVVSDVRAKKIARLL